MTPFEVNIETVTIRFFIMMGIIIAAGFTGVWPLALIGLPIFLTAILGLGKRKERQTTEKLNKEIKIMSYNQKAA